MSNRQPNTCCFTATMRSWRKYKSITGDLNKYVYLLGMAVCVEGIALVLRKLAMQQIASQETALVKLGEFILEMEQFTKTVIRTPVYALFLLMAAAFLILANLPGMKTEPYNIVVQTHSDEPMAPRVEGLTINCYAEKMVGVGPQKMVVTFPWDTLQGVWFEKPNKDADQANCLCIQGKPLCQYTETFQKGEEEITRMTPARVEQKIFQFGIDNILRMEINPLHLENTVSGIRAIMEGR